jgi:lipopolysaccharide export system permease protein
MTRLAGVKVYDREGGTLVRTIEAASARPAAGGWLLDKPTLFNVADTSARTVPSLVIARGVDPTQFTLANVDADEQDFATLKDSIRQMEEAGRPTAALQAGLWHKFSGPLSAVLMPLLAAVAAFGLARSGQLAIRAVIGMALGFAYFRCRQFRAGDGQFRCLPAAARCLGAVRALPS